MQWLTWPIRHQGAQAAAYGASMPLQSCRSCQKWVIPDAKSCPSCGVTDPVTPARARVAIPAQTPSLAMASCLLAGTLGGLFLAGGLASEDMVISGTWALTGFISGWFCGDLLSSFLTGLLQRDARSQPVPVEPDAVVTAKVVTPAAEAAAPATIEPAPVVAVVQAAPELPNFTPAVEVPMATESGDIAITVERSQDAEPEVISARPPKREEMPFKSSTVYVHRRRRRLV